MIAISMGDWWQLSEFLAPSCGTSAFHWFLYLAWFLTEVWKEVIRFPFFEERSLTSVDKIMCKTMFGKTSRGLVWALQRNPPRLNPDGKIILQHCLVIACGMNSHPLFISWECSALWENTVKDNHNNWNKLPVPQEIVDSVLISAWWLSVGLGMWRLFFLSLQGDLLRSPDYFKVTQTFIIWAVIGSDLLWDSVGHRTLGRGRRNKKGRRTPRVLLTSQRWQSCDRAATELWQSCDSRLGKSSLSLCLAQHF